jgi:biotin carboxyl carrier protein
MIKKLRVTVDGRPYDVLVELDEGPAETQAAPAPFMAQSAISLSTAPVIAPANPGAPAAVGTGDVPSPLAGRVTAINVQLGQEVKEGDHLLTLEAMKMNTFVIAPRAGTIRNVKVSVGSAVEEGQPLLTLQ